DGEGEEGEHALASWGGGVLAGAGQLPGGRGTPDRAHGPERRGAGAPRTFRGSSRGTARVDRDRLRLVPAASVGAAGAPPPGARDPRRRPPGRLRGRSRLVAVGAGGGRAAA